MATAEAARRDVASGARCSILAFVGDDSRGQMAAAVARCGFTDGEVHTGGGADALRVLAGMPTPQRLIVDVSDEVDPLAYVAELAHVCDAGTRLLAIGTINDVQLYKALLATGVDDYLVKPVTADNLAGALARLDERVAEPAPEPTKPPCPVVAVVGVRGGVGASTIAVNCAWLLANTLGQRTALVDLDLYFGTCGLALDLEPQRGFRQALESPERIDTLFIERTMVRSSENLFVLAAEDDLDSPSAFNPDALKQLVGNLRRDFDVVVLDMPRFAARTQIPLLAPPLTVVLVADPSLASVRDTVRLAELCKKKLPTEAELLVVLNRVGALKGGEAGPADFKKSAGIDVHYAVSFDGKSTINSIATGQPLAKVAAGSKATKEIRRFAERFVAAERLPAAAPRWRRLIQRRR